MSQACFNFAMLSLSSERFAILFSGGIIEWFQVGGDLKFIPLYTMGRDIFYLTRLLQALSNKNNVMWLLGDMVCGGLGSAALTAGLDGLRGLFQP